MRLRKPYLLFIGDVRDLVIAKTACGLRDWIPDDVVGQYRTSADAVDLGLPDLSPAQAQACGARSIVVGAAPMGGVLPPHWLEALLDAARCGLDVVSGLHKRLTDQPQLVMAARQNGVALHDVRVPPAGIPIASGIKRSGKRVLAIGADCAIGKKYVALAVARDMARRGWDHDFRATGQTGILIAGSGMPMDAVVADFLAGAAEMLSPDAAPDHWDVIEGQGSLFHPSYAGVSLGLLHGSQPDALIYCHSLTRDEIHDMPGYPMPDVASGIARNLDAARLTNPKAQLAGIAINTAHLGEDEARSVAAGLAAQHGAPCVDPMRFGLASLVDRLGDIAR